MPIKAEAVMLSQHDARAEGGTRHVRVSRSEILILRRFAGVDMRILAPVAAYRGVALSVETARDGGLAFRVSLAHADPDLDVVLAETKDSDTVAADWSYWADYLALPRIAESDGEMREVGAARATFARRRNPVAKRRPRFLARRKCGEPARAGVVFSDEREIICYE
ncbi:MAG TPA: DUF6101 family protein [Methylocystis sp.]|nr:DUF6101 family protein [Methylocystis sp.]